MEVKPQSSVDTASTRADVESHGLPEVGEPGARGVENGSRETFRWWVILFGAALIPVNSLWIAKSEALDYSGFPTCASLFFNVVFSLLVLVLLNALVRRWSPRLALNRPELLVIYGMLATGSSLVGHDYMQMLVPTIPHAGFFATPENRWAETLSPLLSSRLTIQQGGEAIKAYEYGHSTLYQWEHLRIWLVPMFYWSTFLCASIASMLSINLILRRQWVENERLSYPVVQIPLLITEGGGSNPLFRNRLFWTGFVLVASIDIMNGLALFYPTIPTINVKVIDLTSFFLSAPAPWKAMGWTMVSLYPFVIGLSFFMPTDMAFSCWFFFLFRKMEIVAAAALGYTGNDPWYPYLKEQSFGAWIALLVAVLWFGRGYLREVVKAAWTGKGTTEDGGVSYRAAFAVLGAGLLVMAGFLVAAGMSVWVAVTYVVLYILFCGSITRVRAEVGPPSHEMGWVGTSNMMVLAFGTAILGPKSLGVLSLLYFQNRMHRGLLMPQFAESLKAAGDSGLRIRTMSIALAVAAVVGVFAAFWALLHLSYSRPFASGDQAAPASWFSQTAMTTMSTWINSNTTPDWGAIMGLATGATAALVLAKLCTVFYGFPFHPAGFALGMSFGLDYIWLPIMISWFCKVVILRLAGIRGYRAAIPFFVGLVLGEFAVGGMWSFLRGVLGVQTYTFFY